MQEEFLASASQRFNEETISLEKSKKEHDQSWLSRFFFSCCKPQSPSSQATLNQTTPNSVNKSISTATTHYSMGGPNSFLDPPKNSAITPMTINIPEVMFPLDIAFLLGKGMDKIISKISKINLDTVSPIQSGELKDLNGNKIFQKTSLKIDSKKSGADGLSTPINCLKGSGDVGRTKLSPFQIFSLYSERLQFDKGEWSEVISDRIAKYAAEKLKDQLIIDTLSGNGANIIQFAKNSPHVIGVETDGAKLSKVKQNAELYQLQDKIDLIQARFFSLQKLKGDVVFLAPSVNSLEIPSLFSIDKHLTTNLSRLIRQSLTMAESVCIMLPPFANIEEVALLFCDIFKEDPNKYTNLNYTLQFDLLYSGDNFVSILVYFGGTNNITFDEQLDVLLSTMNLNSNTAYCELYSKGLIQQLIRYVGTHCSLKVILSLEDLISGDNGRNGASFESFLNKLKEKKIIPREIFRQFGKVDDENELQKTFFLENLGVSDSLPGKPDLTSPKDLNLSQKKRSDVVLWKSPFISPKALPQQLSCNFKTEQFRKANHLNCEIETKEDINDSWDISALQLSSYSLTSAALLDSSSEDEHDESESKVEEIKMPERDSAKFKLHPSEISTSTSLKKGPGKRNNSINRIKLLLYNLATQKVANSPCMPLHRSENSLVSKVI